mmetsp:Transcript_120062/g.208483  ORF Transcript_120062/g.208483 Transcript_120062/m.208483 type:complete len:82 (-) Transcript_120062:61-306(-)
MFAALEARRALLCVALADVLCGVWPLGAMTSRATMLGFAEMDLAREDLGVAEGLNAGAEPDVKRSVAKALKALTLLSALLT